MTYTITNRNGARTVFQSAGIVFLSELRLLQAWQNVASWRQHLFFEDFRKGVEPGDQQFSTTIRMRSFTPYSCCSRVQHSGTTQKITELTVILPSQRSHNELHLENSNVTSNISFEHCLISWDTPTRQLQNRIRSKIIVHPLLPFWKTPMFTRSLPRNLKNNKKHIRTWLLS